MWGFCVVANGALDEIVTQLGQPTLLRWVQAPFGVKAAILRLRHRGGTISLSASHTLRLIFQLSSSEVRRDCDLPHATNFVQAGTLNCSFTRTPERLRIFGAADTLQVLFSPELARACNAGFVGTSRSVQRRLQAQMVKTLLAASLDGSDAQLSEAVAAVATLVADAGQKQELRSGGLRPDALSAMRQMLEGRIRCGVSVAELAQAANLSLHHFIKVCRSSEEVTPHQLLVEERVSKSIPLLLRRRSSVEGVAVELGFSSASHFISTFRRLVGVTPAKLQRAARR